MKIICKSLTGSLIGFLALTVPAGAVTLIPAGVGINITNDGSELVPDISKSDLGRNNPATLYDWLAEGWKIDPGIVSTYNGITGSLLPDPSGLRLVIDDDSAKPFYMLEGSYYAVLHYGKGSGGQGRGGGIVAYYLDDLDAGRYAFPERGLGPNGKGGLSSVRIWGRGLKSPNQQVPDTGGTLALFGLAMAGMAMVRGRKAA